MSPRILAGLLLVALAPPGVGAHPKPAQAPADKALAPGKEATSAAGKATGVPKVPAAPSVPGIPGVPGLSLPGIGADTASNAAGVLQYCAKRKYLGGDAVSAVSSKLLASKGLGTPAKAQKDAGYQSGMKGLLQGSDGKSFSFDSVPDTLKDQACDQVLKSASSLV